MTCVALFVGGPYFDLRTKDTLTFWHLCEKQITCRWDDGRFERYRIPAHDFNSSGDPDTDGASLPNLAKVLRPSLRERMTGAAFVHDSIFHRRFEVMRDGVWVKAQLTMADANELLKALMFIEATTEFERVIVFEALQEFGKRAWDEDAKLAEQNT
jgi:hypothetical protein